MSFSKIIATFDTLLWGWPLIIALFGAHLFMTVRTGFIQKHIFKAIKLSVTKDPDAEGDVSQFGALTAALSSAIGTANIIATNVCQNFATDERSAKILTYITGAVLCIMIGLVIIGGIKKR